MERHTHPHIRTNLAANELSLLINKVVQFGEPNSGWRLARGLADRGLIKYARAETAKRLMILINISAPSNFQLTGIRPVHWIRKVHDISSQDALLA